MKEIFEYSGKVNSFLHYLFLALSDSRSCCPYLFLNLNVKECSSVLESTNLVDVILRTACYSAFLNVALDKALFSTKDVDSFFM